MCHHFRPTTTWPSATPLTWPEVASSAAPPLNSIENHTWAVLALGRTKTLGKSSLRSHFLLSVLSIAVRMLFDEPVKCPLHTITKTKTHFSIIEKINL